MASKSAMSKEQYKQYLLENAKWAEQEALKPELWKGPVTPKMLLEYAKRRKVMADNLK